MISGVVFAPPARSGRAGHILFVRENTLMALPFDAASAQVSGDVFPVAEGVSATSDGIYVPATVSENGVLLYEAGGATGGNQIGWYDRSGKSLGPVGAPGAVLDPAISPDEKSVVFRRTSGAGCDLWVRDLSRGTETRFTSDASINARPFGRPRATASSSRRIEKESSIFIKKPPAEAGRMNCCCRTASTISRLNGRGTAGSSSTSSRIRRTNMIFGFFRPRAPRRTGSPSHF